MTPTSILVDQSGTENRVFPYLCNSCGEELHSIHYDCYNIYETRIAEIFSKLPKTLSKDIIGTEDIKSFLSSVHEKDIKPFVFEIVVGNNGWATIPAFTKDMLIDIAKCAIQYEVAVVTGRAILDTASHNGFAGIVILAEPGQYKAIMRGKSIVNFRRNDQESYPAKRVCPFCNKEIYGRAGDNPEIRIGVVGTPRQGKSALITGVVNKSLDKNA